MIRMPPMSCTVSLKTLRILRRLYPPPDDTADKLLYEGDQFVRLPIGRFSEHMEERLEHIDAGSSDIPCTPSETIQETTEEYHPLVIPG